MNLDGVTYNILVLIQSYFNLVIEVKIHMLSIFNIEILSNM